jgi:SulP family sulfate permease
VAAIILVQGAGVAESAPNGPGQPADSNRDFAAQGYANLAAALFRGQPVGGSVGQTAINVTAGARSRWGGIWSGIWMLAILVLFSGLVAKVALPTLSAVLVFAGIGSLRPRQVLTIWRTGPSSKIALATTLLATLTLPVTAAVGIGVALSLLLQLNQEAMDLRVVRLVLDADGRITEVAPPVRLEDDAVVVLDVYGSLFYAGARTLQVRLPEPGAAGACVVLRLRGRTTLGSTFFSVIAAYARRLEDAGGRLYLSGLSQDVVDYWHDGRLSGLGVSLEVFAATEVIGESTRAAFARAQSRRVHPHD